MPNSPRENLTVARIVKVNHAGEYGAIRIYSAQISVSAWRYPEVVPVLAEMLEHEEKHCEAFFAAMAPRHSRPCRVMPFWSYGGWLLGFITAMFGRQAIWVCTAAVEEAVHRHLDDQLEFLTTRDTELHSIISAIRVEELSHLHHAEAQIVSTAVPYRLLRRLISVVTDALIWLSTWGDSTRVRADLRNVTSA
jgi:ubiquinone biosynthesis monooxygenase Coq7